MQISPSMAEKDNSHETITLHILSNVAVGSTIMNTYWREQIASLHRDALPFQAHTLGPIPSIVLAADVHPQVHALFNTQNTKLELWPTWCTFITTDQSTSESLLLVSISSSTIDAANNRCQRQYQLVLRFVHREHLRLLEAIEQAGKLILCTTTTRKEIPVLFYDPELSLHLEYIHPMFR